MPTVVANSTVPEFIRHRHADVVFTGVTALTPTGLVRDTTVAVREGTITTVGGPALGREIDARGLLLLPGIIDLHGDAIERAMSPRPGVRFPDELALRENDGWLMAAGITTSFCSLTDSSEPGLRSRDTLRRIAALIKGAQRLPMACDLRLHVRHEICLTDGHDELLGWMEAGWVDLLSTADHLPEGGDERKIKRYLAAASRRIGLSESEVQSFIERAVAARELGRRQERELAERALLFGIPLASHDDAGDDQVLASLARGVAICEFPADVATAKRARSGGAVVLMGAPNWVRGGSHLGLMGVAEALEAKVIDALCSDYHYPSLFHAPFLMDERGALGLAEAWELVSLRPARAAGLRAKGHVAPGYDADLLLVERTGNLTPRLRSVYVGGREVARFG